MTILISVRRRTRAGSGSSYFSGMPTSFHDLFDSSLTLFHGFPIRASSGPLINSRTVVRGFRGCLRILEDQAASCAASGASSLVQFGDILTTVQHISDASSLIRIWRDTAAQCGLTAPGLTYNADGLAFIDGQIYRIHCMDNL